MADENKKGITVKIDAALHAQVKEYIESRGMTMAEFITAACDDLFHTKIGVKLCSMAGGGVSRNLWNFFRTAPAGTGQAVTCSTSGMGLRLK